jgi:hypothetical protein
VSIKSSFNRFRTAVIAGAVVAAASMAIAAQADPFKKSWTIAERNNLYCAGFVQTTPMSTANRVVGAVEEQDGFMFAQSDFVYLNMGSGDGINVGDRMSIVRPRGTVNTKWTDKGSLGFYVQEVGAVEIVRVKAEFSVARIVTSCDSFLLGDLVQPLAVRTSPMYVDRPALDLFADPSGKARGRVFMARDNQEMITRDQIVYIDLGAEDNVRIGDYLTIYRPLGEGNLLLGPNESVAARSYGYESLEYKGGRFSNQAARKRGDEARGRVVTTRAAKDGRPDIRKVVGEMVILNVKERTATAVITRTAQEVHTGDWVEVQ